MDYPITCQRYKEHHLGSTQTLLQAQHSVNAPAELNDEHRRRVTRALSLMNRHTIFIFGRVVSHMTDGVCVKRPERSGSGIESLQVMELVLYAAGN